MAKGNDHMRVSKEFKNLVKQYKMASFCKTDADVTRKFTKELKRTFRVKKFLRIL